MKKKANSSSKKKQTAQGLRKWNLWAAGIHLVQGIAVLLASRSVSWPITTNYLTTNAAATAVTGHPVISPASHTLFSVNIAYLIAIFFFVSALMHVLIGTVYRTRYEASLKRQINRVHWVEYGVTAGLMVIAIALVAGVYDFSSLLMIFVLSLVMGCMALFMEIRNQENAKPSWLAYGVGCLAGLVPWVVLAMYLWATNMYGTGGVATYVYFIFFSVLVLFVGFAVCMYLQAKRIGRWADYLYAERAYLILSIVAKAALAWQLYAGALKR
jgi:hypothetical protein